MVVQRSETDCLRAAVASVLDLSYDDVPDFFAAGRGWFGELQNWLLKRGLFLASSWDCLPDGAIGLGLIDLPEIPGEWHTVVMRGGEIIHDPATGQTSGAPSQCYAFAVVNPASALRRGGEVPYGR